MPELLRSKRVVARKWHLCQTCNGQAIARGEEYQRDTYVYDGRIYDWVQCKSCTSMAQFVFAWAIDTDEGIGLDDYAEWAHEHTDHPELGLIARDYLARLHRTSGDLAAEKQKVAV